MTMNKKKKHHNWKRDTRMTCELFYLNDPSCAEKPYLNPEPKSTVVKEFKVSSFDEAIELTRDFNKNDLTKKYYWRRRRKSSKGGMDDYGIWHEDGICSWGLNDVDEWFASRIAKFRKQIQRIDKEIDGILASSPDGTLHEWVLRLNKIKLVRKIAKTRKLSTCKFLRKLVQLWISTCDWCGWNLKDKWANMLSDWNWRRKCIKAWKKTGHDPQECWSLELHLLFDIRYNLKQLNENGYCMNSEFIKDVLVEEHGNEPNFNVEEALTKMYSGSSKDYAKVEEKASNLQKETYSHIIHLVDLYEFYMNQEINGQDIYDHPELRTPDMVEIYIEGTYDMIDYMKMYEKGKDCWNEIWDLIRKYGQQMGD